MLKYSRLCKHLAGQEGSTEGGRRQRRIVEKRKRRKRRCRETNQLVCWLVSSFQWRGSKYLLWSFEPDSCMGCIYIYRQPRIQRHRQPRPTSPLPILRVHAVEPTTHATPPLILLLVRMQPLVVREHHPILFSLFDTRSNLAKPLPRIS